MAVTQVSNIGSLLQGGGSLQGSSAPVQSTIPVVQGSQLNLQPTINANQLNTATLPQAPASTNYVGGSTTTAPTAEQIAAQQAAQQAAAQAAQRASMLSQLNGQLGQLDNQQNIGLGNIGNSYNQSANRLDTQHQGALHDYQDQVALNNQNYSTARTGVQQNVRSTANALQRLLGLNGAGNSSAAYDQAPYAAALQGTQQLAPLQQSYNQNNYSLDKSKKQTEDSYNNALSDLNNQRFQNENSLKSSIAQTRAGLLGQIDQVNGNQGNQGAINDLLSQITGLSNQWANPVMRTQDVAYQGPQLSQYGLGHLAAPVSSTPGTSDVAPGFLNVLASQKDRQDNIYG